METWRESFFRPNAAAFEIYNESNVFCCFDESNRKSLRKTLAKEEHWISEKKRKQLATKRSFVVFDVPRDLATYGFVDIGAPPTSQELGDGNWRSTQFAELSLPSGLLRLETAMSYSLGEEIPEDDGAFVEVPPGDYRLAFVVAEFTTENRPHIFLTLEPLGEITQPIRLVVRAAPPPLPKHSKLGQYTLDAGTFSGFRQGGVTNFDSKAARQLRLTFADRLRVQGKSGTHDAWYLGHFGEKNYCLTESDFLFLSDWCPAHIDDWFCVWERHFDAFNWNVLKVCRFASHRFDPRTPSGQIQVVREQVTVAKDEPVVITVLPDRLDFGTASWGIPQQKEGKLHAQVLTLASTVFTLNVSAADLSALGGGVGKVHDFDIGGQRRRLLLVSRQSTESPRSRLSQLRAQMLFNSDLLVDLLIRLKESENIPPDIISPVSDDEKIRVDAARFVAWENGRLLNQVGPRTKKFMAAAAKNETITVGRLEQSELPLLAGVAFPHWSDPAREILWVESACYRRLPGAETHPDDAIPHGVQATMGSEVTISMGTAPDRASSDQ